MFYSLCCLRVCRQSLISEVCGFLIQAAAQHRGSMSSHNHQSPTGRIQAESLSGRLRSDSNITASAHDESGDGIAVHPVSERARTAILPPIMASPSPYPYRDVFPKLGNRLAEARSFLRTASGLTGGCTVESDRPGTSHPSYISRRLNYNYMRRW